MTLRASGASPGNRAIRLRRFRLHLTTLILLSIVPALVLAVWTGLEQRKSERNGARERAVLLARLAAADQEHFIEETRRILEPLASLPIIHTTNYAFWNLNFKNLQTLNPRYAAFGMLGADGRMLSCSLPCEDSRDDSKRAFFVNAKRTAKFAVGEPEADFLTNATTVTFARPLFDENRNFSRVLFATATLGRFQELCAESEIPPQSVLRVLDRKGETLCQIPPEAENHIRSSSEWIQRISQESEGALELSDPDGIRRLYAFAAVRNGNESPLVAAVGIPTGVVYAKANQTLARNLLILMLVALAALGFSKWYASRRVLSPLTSLAETARKLASGDLEARVALKENSEFYQLAETFNEMADGLQGGISRLEKANTELSTAEAKFRRLVEQSLAGIYIIQDGRFVYVNPKMAEIFNYSAEELRSRPLLEFIAVPDREKVNENLRRRESGEVESIQYELRILRRDGREIDVEVHGARSEYKGRPAVLGMLLDITERRAAAEAIRKLNAELAQRVEERTAELKAANDELARSSKLKDEFLANMSHELRTPLNAILGLSESLLEQVSGTLNPRQVKAITTISSSGTHLLALINDILDLSKIEAGKLELHPGSIEADDFCNSCLAFVKTQAMHKHIAVSFENKDGVATVMADPKRLKQILVNLLTNAVKFTPEGGSIGLTISQPPNEDKVQFSVWDTGIGIAPAEVPKLFQAFTQIDSGLNRAQEGTGLGLALVAKLVELHGGSVSLQSEPARGSRFTITLPRKASERSVPESKAVLDRSGYRRALLIDDDPTSGEQLARYLAEFGVTTVIHARGDESVEAALREQPDFILLDILLPGESGWMVLARLKEHPGTKDIPVVIVSVLDEPEKSRAWGASAHLTKPVAREQLAHFLQRPAVRNSAATGASRTPEQSSRPVILLAEDNPANIQTIGDYLLAKGYEIHCAVNGELAVSLANEVHPDCILMDVQMPVMDGLSAMRVIRAQPQMKETPIVALTALAMPGDRERCIAAGATEYLSKPVSLKTLASLITGLLPPEKRLGGLAEQKN